MPLIQPSIDLTCHLVQVDQALQRANAAVVPIVWCLQPTITTPARYNESPA
jgi:hypothetical protein